MILTHRLQEAINEAARLHRDQLRYDPHKTPYITHLVGVMMLLSSATHDEDVLVAGLLHDALEDVPDYTPDMMEQTFGTRVKDIVMGVTEEFKLKKEKAPSWRIEKIAYIDHLKASSDESVMVSLADKIQNTRSLIELMNQAGSRELNGFGSSQEEKLWFHREVLALGEERLGEDHVLVDELRMELEEMERVLEKLSV